MRPGETGWLQGKRGARWNYKRGIYAEFSFPGALTGNAEARIGIKKGKRSSCSEGEQDLRH